MASANIFQQYLAPAKSVLDYQNEMDAADARKAQVQGLQQQNALQALTMDQTRGQIADAAAKRNAIQQVYAANPNADPLTRARALQNNPLTADVGVAAEKALLENDKTRAGTAKDQAEADAKTADIKWKLADRHAQQLAFVKTPQDAAAWVDEGIREGSLPPEGRDRALQMIQANGVDAWKQMAGQAAIPVLEKFKQDAETKRTQMSNDTSRANNAATVAATIRGQNLTDARARETNAASLTKPFEVTGPDGNPMLVQQDKQGNITPVQGFGPKSGASKPLTDSQSKALLFGSRMRDSDQVLGDLAAQGVEQPSLIKRAAESVPLVGGALGMAANSVSTPQQQQVEQAQRDFINAVLRRESGAAIAESEFANAKQQYFPQPGDSAQVKQQKARNRSLAIQGMLAEVPAGQRNSVGGAANAPTAAPSPSSKVVNFADLK